MTRRTGCGGVLCASRGASESPAQRAHHHIDREKYAMYCQFLIHGRVMLAALPLLVLLLAHVPVSRQESDSSVSLPQTAKAAAVLASDATREEKLNAVLGPHKSRIDQPTPPPSLLRITNWIANPSERTRNSQE